MIRNLGVLFLCCGLASAGFTQSKRPMSVNDMLAVKQVQSPVLSPDGTRAAFTVREPAPSGSQQQGYSAVWILNLDTGGVRRFTRARSNATSPTFSADGKSLYFKAKRGAEANHQVWSIPLDGGEATPVTQAAEGVLSYRLSRTGKWIAFRTTAPKAKSRKNTTPKGRDAVVAGQHVQHHLLMVQPLDGQTPATRIGPEDKTVFEMDWAPDDRHLAIMFADSPRSDDNYMFRSLAIIDRQNSALRILARDVGKMVAPRVSPDGRNLIWLGASQKNDATTGTLWTIPLKGGKRSALNKDLEETIYAADWLSRTSLLVTAVRGTRSHLSIRKLSGISRTLSLSKHAPIFLSAHHSSGRYVIAGDTPKRPSALYFGTLKQPQPTLKYDPNPQIRDIHFATQRTYEWTASDGKTLQGVLVEPMPGTPRPAPLILAVHGGPEWQSLDGWVNRYLSPAQLLAQRGYAVLFPNYRGSAGRGAPFAMSDHKDLGGQEFQDHIDAINALATDGLIDSKRVGMMGGSYGGYMSALAATKGSKHFAAAINFAGIANWMSFTGTSDIPYENSITHWDLWCYDKPETCWKASPLAYVAQAKTPLLLVHGENDKRVPIGQAHELHTAFKRFKIPVQLITYPREGHGLREWAHREDFINRALSWFDQYVRKN